MSKKEDDELKKILMPDAPLPPTVTKAEPKAEEVVAPVENKEEKTDAAQQGEQQYYVLPPQPQQQDWGFGIPVNAGTPEQANVARKKMRRNQNSKSNGITAWILLAVGIACGAFGAYLKTVLFVDKASTIILSLFGFGIVVYGLLFIAVLLSIASIILAIVQIVANRRAFSIVTIILVPLLNIAALIVELLMFAGNIL